MSEIILSDKIQVNDSYFENILLNHYVIRFLVGETLCFFEPIFNALDLINVRKFFKSYCEHGKMTKQKQQRVFWPKLRVLSDLKLFAFLQRSHNYSNDILQCRHPPIVPINYSDL
jgi:hypothetical protein